VCWLNPRDKANQADHWHLPGMGVDKEFVYDRTRGKATEKRLLPSRVSASCIATATGRQRADTVFMRSTITGTRSCGSMMNQTKQVASTGLSFA
jgi:hypothetical protein